MENLILMLEEKTKKVHNPKDDGRLTISSHSQNFKVKIISADDRTMEFDAIGINCALINTLRRILISEVPTMAIEKVYITSNSSPLQDEILAHRLGLVPLKANARLFQFRLEGDDEGTDRDTLHFELKIKCIKNASVRYGHYRPEDLYINYEVYSKFIKWIPIGEQKNLYKESEIGPVDDDIMVAKLRPGLDIDVKMEAVKGIGRDHAKFSPVGTAAYRLLPYVKLLEEIEDDQAELLKGCFSPGVIGITEHEGKKKAFVQNARIDSCSRNIYRHDELRDKVVIGRVKDHYIFTIESVVALTPDDLFREAIKILQEKCETALEILRDLYKNKT